MLDPTVTWKSRSTMNISIKKKTYDLFPCPKRHLITTLPIIVNCNRSSHSTMLFGETIPQPYSYKYPSCALHNDHSSYTRIIECIDSTTGTGEFIKTGGFSIGWCTRMIGQVWHFVSSCMYTKKEGRNSRRRENTTLLSDMKDCFDSSQMHPLPKILKQ